MIHIAAGRGYEDKRSCYLWEQSDVRRWVHSKVAVEPYYACEKSASLLKGTVLQGLRSSPQERGACDLVDA